MTNSPALAPKQIFAPTSSRELTVVGPMVTELLTNEHQSEILAFLAARPLHTVVMAGHIRDNGVVSVFNRGTFHAYRGLDLSLEGVALIGHATFMETRSDEALRAFAKVAQESPEIHLIMGEQEKLDRFWSYYAQAGQPRRAVGRESLMEQRWPLAVDQMVSGLRQATAEDLEVVMLVQAKMALAEGGVNPLETDPSGFRRRSARRIELGRTWVWREDQNLIFKVDIMAETPEAVYLEGVWVNPRDRGKDFGLRCMRQLGRNLLKNTDSLCLLVNEGNLKAHAFYRRAGFRLHGSYQSVYLQSRAQAKQS